MPVVVVANMSSTKLCERPTKVANNWLWLQMKTPDFTAEPMCHGKSVGGNHQEMESER